MPLGLGEIRSRAIAFSKDWADARYEKGETQSFYNDFFQVFGISRRRVAVYEQTVKRLDNSTGFIDLFWPGQLLIEQKSAGRDLAKARDQAHDYLHGLKNEEWPRRLLLSDFQTFELIDLETGEETSFALPDLHKYVGHFAFIAGYEVKTYRDQDPVNIEAAGLMTTLHKLLEESGYIGHDLEMLLVRLMFCLFADDTGIFEKDLFLYCLENQTREDGTDVGGFLLTVFDVLNTPPDKRARTLDDDLRRLEYVNGALFEKPMRPPPFNRVMRDALLAACRFDWSPVSPALFGSLFQTVMLPAEQRKKGAHYTSERNILKVIEPLFLEDLRAEFKRIENNKRRLEEFHKKLATIRILDPACGCGNFLILAYRELRELETEVLKLLYGGAQVLDVRYFSIVDVDQFYGIELEEFPARIAEVALWLTDHQQNMKLSLAFGKTYARLPLKKAAKIVHDNALTINWRDVAPPETISYIIGNPPFIGSKFMSAEQRGEIAALFPRVKGAGVLDYVCGWYAKAADYMKSTPIKAAFVSTNSITQGEQVGILWHDLLTRRRLHIQFAHRTFKWTIDEKAAKGMKVAAVFVVIVGFAEAAPASPVIFEYETPVALPHRVTAKNINPYLVDGPNVFLLKRTKPISDAPEIWFGNMPNDGGHLLFTDEEKADFLRRAPAAERFIKPFVSAHEFINGEARWCLWLKGVSPAEYRNIPEVMARVQEVRLLREKSSRATTQALATTPYLFGEIRQPEANYILIPRHSSETRHIIPFSFLSSEQIVADSCLAIPSASLYHFGVLTSSLHMAWVSFVCGRLKSDYRYSNTLVYNNFPWPEKPTASQQQAIAIAAQAVLDARAHHPGASLADLYDPNTMPPDLVKAHRTLDAAVDAAYAKKKFTGDTDRVAFLFEMYQRLAAPLDKQKKSAKRRS